MNIDKLFPFVADTVFRARCIACISAVNLQLNFGSETGSVPFPVVAATPTVILLMERCVYMCFLPLYFFSTTSINFFC